METKTLPDWASDLPIDPSLDWLDPFQAQQNQQEEDEEISKFLDNLEDMLVKDGPYSEF